jgi:hypothetical protein
MHVCWTLTYRLHMLGILNDALDTWDQWFKSVDFDTKVLHGFEVRVPSVWMRATLGIWSETPFS